jgi:hypothetical protein
MIMPLFFGHENNKEHVLPKFIDFCRSVSDLEKSNEDDSFENSSQL